MSKMFIPPFCINCISHTFLSCQMTVRMGLKVNITRINGLYHINYMNKSPLNATT